LNRIELHRTASAATKRCGARWFRVAETDAVVWDRFKEVVTSPQVFLAKLRDGQARHREALQTDDSELQDLEGLIEEQTAELRVAAAEYTHYASRGGMIAEPRLAIADGDFKIRRALIEAFGWRFTLVWRGAQRVVVVRW
jgi:hypothetical protein